MEWKKIIADQISKALVSIICKELQLNKKKKQINNRQQYHFLFTKITKSRRQIITSVGKDVENSDPHSLLVEIKWYSHFGKQFGSSSRG